MIPSTKPSPARRIGTRTRSLPSTWRPVVCSSGVWTATSADGRSRRLVGEEHPDLRDQFLEVARVGPLVAEERDLVLDQRMIEDNELRGRGGHI